MSVVQVSGATIGAFHEIAFIANRNEQFDDRQQWQFLSFE
jgi:hypothetical protein